MTFEFFMARKHLTHKQKTGFISMISMISVAGVAVGVMALIVVLAVMSGFDRELKSKIVSVQPHLRIEKIGGVNTLDGDLAKLREQRIPGIISMAGFVEGQAIIRSEANATGVIIKGLDPSNEDLGVYKEHMRHGFFDLQDAVTTQTKRRMLFFKTTSEEHMGGMVVGEELAARLEARVGDVVNLISPFQDPDKPFFVARAENRPFVIRGIFRVGMSDFDSALVLIDQTQAQEMYHLGSSVTGISIRFRNVDDAEKWKFQIRGVFPSNYFIRSWFDMNHNFFQALKVEKSVMTILLALIVMVAVFNIVATLTMVVMEKTKDIGILRALGATRAAISRIFLIEGFSIGFLGIVSGTILGLFLAFNLNPISDFIKQTTGLEVFPSDIYYFDRIPADVHPEDVIVTVCFALVACILAGVYPAMRAASLNPVEALRHE